MLFITSILPLTAPSYHKYLYFYKVLKQEGVDVNNDI